MAETSTTSTEPMDLSAEEFARLLEQRTQRDLGMSLDAFLAALDAGELPDSPAVMNLAILVGARSR
jgi:hypothetical protein